MMIMGNCAIYWIAHKGHELYVREKLTYTRWD